MLLQLQRSSRIFSSRLPEATSQAKLEEPESIQVLGLE